MSLKTSLLYVILLYGLLLTIPLECYGKSSSIMISNYRTDSWEVQISARVADYIENCSLASSYSTYCLHNAGTGDVYNGASGNGHTYSVAFYHGHSCTGDWSSAGTVRVWNGIFWEEQYDIIDNSGNLVLDKDIYSYSACRNVKFVFLLSCDEGNTIGGTHLSGTPFGMPYAWLHTTDLAPDGYTGADGKGYTFMGFTGVAPYFTASISTFCDTYYFVSHFYRYAMTSGYTIKDALDAATGETWGSSSFSDSVYYNGFTVNGDCGRMVVYGDGGMSIGSAPSLPQAPKELPVGPPPGHNCPTLFAWNGVEFADEGVLNIHAESDITVHHRIQSSLAPQDGALKLQLRELDNYTSHVDQVKLYAVDKEGKWHICPLTYAGHSEHGCVTLKLIFDDENRVDLAPTQVISLRFFSPFPYQRIDYFMFEINGYNRKPMPL